MQRTVEGVYKDEHTQRENCQFYIYRFGAVAIAAAQPAKADLGRYNDPPSRLRGMIEKFDEDYGILDRFYTARTSPNRSGRLRQLYSDELIVLDGLNFDSLNHDEQVDFVLFKNYLEHEQKETGRGPTLSLRKCLRSCLLPYRSMSWKTHAEVSMISIRQRPRALLNELAKTDRATRKRRTDAGSQNQSERSRTARPGPSASCEMSLRRWYGYYNIYDPMFTWWNESPYKAVDELCKIIKALSLTKLVGIAPGRQDDDHRRPDRAGSACCRNCITR